MPLIGLAVVLHPFWTQAVCFINYLVALFADLIEMISKIPGKIVFGKNGRLFSHSFGLPYFIVF
ncbi:hypothetical protein X299_08810 [Oenococcus oeni IOEB_S277]|nr:hypothetical protein X299_08810 [Oenococcus oeni IOEB_S277]